jgi:deoxyribose-phosphate aldolase
MGIEFKREPTTDEVEQICLAAEQAAREYLLSKVPLKRVSDLDVTVDAVGDKPLVVNVDVAIELASGNQDSQTLVDEATELAFSAAEAKARELDLCVNMTA